MKPNKQAEQHYLDGWQHYLADRYDEAKAQLVKAIEIEPDWAQPHLLFGQIYYLDENSDYKAALREFERVVYLDPTWDEGYFWQSVVFERLGRLNKACKAVRVAMRLNPSDPRYPVALGDYLMQRGKYIQAIKAFRSGIKLKPHYGRADAHLFLAAALLADGRIKAARKEWKFVLTLEPMYPNYKVPHKEARRMLKKHPKP